MFETLKLRVRGVRPLLMNNGVLANPISKEAIAMKEAGARYKKDKTEANFEEMCRVEFLGGLWLHDGKVCIPSEAIEAALIKGSAPKKRGPAVKSGVVVPEPAILDYPGGPLSPVELWESGDFRFTTSAVVARRRVQRTRPIFRSWSASILVEFLPDVIDAGEIEAFAAQAGYTIGIGNWRPRYGTFSVERM